MRSPKTRYSPWSSSSGKVKSKARVKERREYAGTEVKVITTADIARMTHKTTAGQVVVGSKTSKDAGKGWDAGKSDWNILGNRAKAKTCKGAASPKIGKARADRMIGALQRGKARAARKAAAQATCTALTKPVTLTGGRSQTDHIRAHNQKK